MRPGPNKRSRGRNNNNSNMQNGGGGGGFNGRPRPPHRQQTFDSNGPGIKIWGNAYQVFERYVALAREATVAGDRIAAENFFQHAEHYYRIMNANGENPAMMAARQATPADPEPSDQEQVDMGEPAAAQPPVPEEAPTF